MTEYPNPIFTMVHFPHNSFTEIYKCLPQSKERDTERFNLITQYSDLLKTDQQEAFRMYEEDEKREREKTLIFSGYIGNLSRLSKIIGKYYIFNS